MFRNFKKSFNFSNVCSFSKGRVEGSSSVPRAKNFVGNVVFTRVWKKGLLVVVALWNIGSREEGREGVTARVHLHCTKHRNHPLHGSFPQPLAATISAPILTGERVTFIPTSTRDCIVFTLDQSCPIFFIPLSYSFSMFRIEKAIRAAVLNSPFLSYVMG